MFSLIRFHCLETVFVCIPVESCLQLVKITSFSIIGILKKPVWSVSVLQQQQQMHDGSLCYNTTVYTSDPPCKIRASEYFKCFLWPPSPRSATENKNIKKKKKKPRVFLAPGRGIKSFYDVYRRMRWICAWPLEGKVKNLILTAWLLIYLHGDGEAIGWSSTSITPRQSFFFLLPFPLLISRIYNSDFSGFPAWLILVI